MKTAAILILFFGSMNWAHAKQSLTCKGNLFLYDAQMSIRPLNNPKIEKNTQISEEKCRSLKLSFEKTRGVVRVNPWQGMSWNKMAFAYNQDVKFAFDSDGANWFKVEVDYRGEKKFMSCKKRRQLAL